MYDLRQAAKGVIRRPMPFLTAASILSLGIAAAAVVFAVADAALIRPLPYARADRLVVLTEFQDAGSHDGGPVSPGTFVDVRGRSRSLTQVAAFFAPGRSTLLSAGESTETIRTIGITSDFFALLGVTSAIGRLFTPEEFASNTDHAVVMISYGFWKRHWGGVMPIGQTIQLEGRSFQVIGVLPESFRFIRAADVWTPLSFERVGLRQRGTRYLSVIARLRDQTTLESARRELVQIDWQLAREYPKSNAGWHCSLKSLRETLFGNTRVLLVSLLGSVAVVLAIACVNVTGLMLARFVQQQSELAVCLALGATRARLLIRRLADAAVLSATSATVAGWLVVVSLSVLESLWADSVLAITDIRLDARLWMIMAGLSVCVSAVPVLLPILSWTVVTPSESLKQVSRSATGRRRHLEIILSGEVALTLALVSVAILLVRTVVNLQLVDLGFRTRSVTAFEIRLPGMKYRQPDRVAAVGSQLLSAIQTLPAVRAAGAISYAPLTGDALSNVVEPADEPSESAKGLLAAQHVVSHTYFDAVGVTLKQGRTFTGTDDRSHEPVAILNESLARILWPSTTPVGRSIRLGTDVVASRRVVGVVNDTRFVSVERSGGPEVYIPYFQLPLSFFTVAVSTAKPEAVMAAVRPMARNIDADIFVGRPVALAHIAQTAIARPRINASVMVLFALVGLVLAAAGVHSITAFKVNQRTKEFGIRTALGATRLDLIRLVMASTLRMVLIGVVVGIGLGLVGQRLASRLLFGVVPGDLGTVVVSVSILLALGSISSWYPAYRAATVDPAAAIRCE